MEHEGLYDTLSLKLTVTGVEFIKLSAAVDMAEVSCAQVRDEIKKAFDNLMSAIAEIEKADLE